MSYCETCGSVHFPGQCRAQADGGWDAFQRQRLSEYVQHLIKSQPYNFYFGFRYAVQQPTVPDVFQSGWSDDEQQPIEDGAVYLCPHCQPAERVSGAIHGCDGNDCQCALCNPDTGLLSTLTVENQTWNNLERWGLAYPKP